MLTGFAALRAQNVGLAAGHCRITDGCARPARHSHHALLVSEPTRAILRQVVRQFVLIARVLAKDRWRGGSVRATREEHARHALGDGQHRRGGRAPFGSRPTAVRRTASSSSALLVPANMNAT